MTDMSTRAQASDRICEGIDLRHVAPFTTLLVRTLNSLYRVVIADGPEGYVQGGTYFPDPTLASLDGVSMSGHGVTGGWISVGLALEIRSGEHWVVTSTVLGIAARSHSDPVVH
jgi:hypothetical protein